MPNHCIQNFEELAQTSLRQDALEIIEAGLSSIDTQHVVQKNVQLNGSILSIQAQEYDLHQYENIRVIGFGKASCEAAYALEQILGDHLTNGAAIGTHKTTCETIHTYQGTHPRPSSHNVDITEKLVKISQQAGKNDLVLAVVSGGGSALLCYPESECEQGQRLYNKFLESGGSIQELNTVRKHLSALKGGGLAKMLHPATVAGLIFSDVPGGHPEYVASGPTYPDKSTIQDARHIIKKYKLGNYELNKTPKEDKYFQRVKNFPLVSNAQALDRMKEKAKNLDYNSSILSSEIYENDEKVLNNFFKKAEKNTVLLGGGEPAFQIPPDAGKGGRNQQLALRALAHLSENQVFASIASDGTDNTEAAGALVDFQTINSMEELNLSPETFSRQFNSYPFFEKTGDHIITGPTGSNVADLILLINQ